jgi:predicted dehydrogenase
MLLPDQAAVAFDAYLEVIGDKGVAQVRVPEQSTSYWLEDGTSTPDLGTWPLLRSQPVGALKEELRYFVNCVQKGEPVRHGTPEQAWEALRVALAIVESAQKREEVLLK